MSYRDLRNFTEMMRALGYPRLISMENFRSPNFALVSEILQWLVKRYDPGAELPMDTETEQDRVLFIKSVAQFMGTKAHIKLNAKKLYGADGYAVKELLKVASMLYEAMRTNTSDPDARMSRVPAEQFDISNKAADLKMVRQLASEITEHGSSLSALLKQEVELQEMRSGVIGKPLELNEIERELKTSINQVHGKTREVFHRLENLAGDEANLEARIEKKKQELERNQKRLKSLQNVRPAFMDEYEKLEGDLKRQYEEYIDRFRNLTYLEHQLEELNRIEQEKLEATNSSLQEMQKRMQEHESFLHGGQDPFSLTGDSGVEHDEDEEDDDDDEDDIEVGSNGGKTGRRMFGNMTGDGLDDEGSSLSTAADSEDVEDGQFLGEEDDDDDDDDLRGGFGPRSVGDEDQLVEDLDEKEFFDNSELGERPDELSTEDGNLLRLEQSREEDEEVIGDAHSDEANGVASEEDETGEDEDDIFDDKKDVADLQNLDGAEEDAEDEDMEEEAPVKSEEGVISGYLSRKEEFFSRSPLIIESEVLLSLLKEHPFAFEPDNSDQIALDFLARVHPVKIEEYVPMGGVKATKDRAKVKLYDLPGQKGPKQSLDTRETLNKKYKGKRFANDAGFVLDDDQLPITKKKTDPCELYYVEEVSSVLVNVNSKETSTVSFFPGDFRASATIENVISAVLRHIGVENAIPAMMSCADGYVIYKDTKLLELDEDKRNNLVCTIGSQLYYHCHFPSGLWDDIDIVPEKLDSFLFSLALEQYSSKTVTLNAADYFVWPRFDDKQLEQAENPVTVQIFPYRGIIAVTVHSPADESDSVLKLPLLVTTCPSTLLEYVRQVLKEDFTHFMVRDTKRILPQHIPVGHTCPNGAELVTIKVDEEWDITAVQSQPPHQVKTIALTGRKTYLDVTKDIEAVAPDIIEEFNEVGLAYGQSRMCFQKRAVFSHDSLGSTPLLIVDGAKTKKRSLPVYIYDSLTYEREKNNEYLLEMAEIDAEIPIPSRLLSQFVSFFDDEADRSLLSPGSHPFGTIEEVNVLFGRSTDVSKLLLSGKPMARIALGCWTVVKPELSKVKISVEKDSREVAQIELELTDQRVLIRDLKMAAAALVGEKSKRCFFTLPLGDEKINEEAAVTCLSPAQESEDDGQPFSFDLKMTVEEGPEEADLFLQFEDHKLEIEVEVDKTYDEVVTEMFEHMGMAELVSNLRAYNITLNGTPCERTEAESGETLKDLLEFVIEEDNPFAEIIVSVEPISKTFHVGIKGASDETFTANLPLTLNKAAVLQEVATSLNVEGKEENSCSLLVNGTELSDDDCLFTIYEFLSDEDLEHLTIEIDVEENEATSEAIDDY
eukprot:m.172298 g.172298  ORF g.172298 m.172298 type:complete len:1343 (+) comp39084_c0_seq21:24-4052(+)